MHVSIDKVTYLEIFGSISNQKIIVGDCNSKNSMMEKPAICVKSIDIIICDLHRAVYFSNFFFLFPPLLFPVFSLPCFCVIAVDQMTNRNWNLCYISLYMFA